MENGMSKVSRILFLCLAMSLLSYLAFERLLNLVCWEEIRGCRHCSCAVSLIVQDVLYACGCG